MKIHVISAGTTEFTADPEYAGPAIREAIEDGCNDVASTITDWTDTERSNIGHDDSVTVTEDDGTPLWSGWLGGVTGPPPADRAALEQLAATAERQRIALAAINRIVGTVSDRKTLPADAISLIDDELSVLSLDADGDPDPVVPLRPAVIVFDINEGIQGWFRELASEVYAMSGERVIITEVDAQMSDVMLAVADHEVSYDEAAAIWHSDGDDE